LHSLADENLSQYYERVSLTDETSSSVWEILWQAYGPAAMVYEPAWRYGATAARECPGSPETSRVQKMDQTLDNFVLNLVKSPA
jgi:hypothetical protein